MVKTIPDQLTQALEDLKREVASLSERLAKVEGRSEHHAAPPVAAAAAAPAAPAPQPEPGITAEELLAISGALAAYLGVRPHIRQIRLIGSRAWAQQGRVSIQASHRLQ